MNTFPNAKILSESGCPGDILSLIGLIGKTGNSVIQSFDSLEKAIKSYNGFENRTLPFLHREALLAPEAFRIPIPVLGNSGEIILSQRQCLCILANAFFCTFSERVSFNCMSGPFQPSINLDELYVSDGSPGVQVAKLHMLFHYFDRCRERLDSHDELSGKVHFIRRRAYDSTLEDWIGFDRRLILPEVYPLGVSLDTAKNMLKVDFANKCIGGGAIAYGCVQEEILFCIFPELIVSRLFCPEMDDDEAIIVTGAEQFTKADGYGMNLKYGGPFHDPTPINRAGMRQSYFAAIDAFDFRQGGLEKQFSQQLVLRELTKALAGFDVHLAPDLIATGNWGCGEFRGDSALKSLIQWVAATRAGKIMHYFPWSDEKICTRLPFIAARLVERNWTVGNLASFLLERAHSGDVFNQIEGGIRGDCRP